MRVAAPQRIRSVATPCGDHVRLTVACKWPEALRSFAGGMRNGKLHEEF